MGISPYVRALRDKVGSARLLLPSVAALVHDDAGRLLLVLRGPRRPRAGPGRFDWGEWEFKIWYQRARKVMMPRTGS